MDIELEMARRTVSAALPIIGVPGIMMLSEMLATCCSRCDIYDKCEFAFDLYNADSEPKIDCLATK